MFDTEFAPGPAAIAFAFAVLLMLVIWALHLRDEDASIVDPVWGLAVFGVGWTYALAAGVPLTGARLLGLLLAGAWALRLGVHLSQRHARTGEDRRYRKMREARGAEWWWRSVYVVFLLQAVLAWMVALPLMAVVTGSHSLNFLGALGLLIGFAGFLFEAIADGQLAAFQRREAEGSGGVSVPGTGGAVQEKSVMDRGLWRFSRHPNYFGESVVWWGIGLVALSQGVWWAILGPVLITFMLLKVSGVTMTESDISDRRPAYKDYIRRTSAFFPARPKHLPAEEVAQGSQERP